MGPRFVVEINNYSISGDDPMSLTSLLAVPWLLGRSWSFGVGGVRWRGGRGGKGDITYMCLLVRSFLLSLSHITKDRGRSGASTRIILVR